MLRIFKAKFKSYLEGFEMKGGVERDGIFLVIRDEKAKEAELIVKQWLLKIKFLK